MTDTNRTTGAKAGSRNPRKKKPAAAGKAIPKSPRTKAAPRKKKAIVRKTGAARTSRKLAAEPATGAPISLEERRKMIADAAFYKAASRGFVGGDPDRDWLEAEAEIDAMLLDRTRDET